MATGPLGGVGAPPRDQRRRGWVDNAQTIFLVMVSAFRGVQGEGGADSHVPVEATQVPLRQGTGPQAGRNRPSIRRRDGRETSGKRNRQKWQSARTLATRRRAALTFGSDRFTEAFRPPPRGEKKLIYLFI